MSSIPEEIHFEILLKVPVKSLLACKCVCKTWLSLISNPDFARTQLNLSIQRNDNPNLMLHGRMTTTGYRGIFYSISHGSLNSLLSREKDFHDYAVELGYPFKPIYSAVMCSCDGLFCLWFGQKGLFCIWNPATREYKKLPESDIPYVTMVAFGYDYKTNDYKILAGDEICFEVYSLGLNSWRRVVGVPYKFYGNRSGVLVNGDLHWLGKRQEFSQVIVSVDIRTEIFKEMELPQELCDHFFNLGVLEGCLCSLVRDVDRHMEIWVMQNYGVRESWTKHYTVKTEVDFGSCDWMLICSFKTGEILFADGCGGLFSYDLECGSVRKPNISDSTHFFQPEFYYESLISLKSRTYVGGEEQIEEESEGEEEEVDADKDSASTC